MENLLNLLKQINFTDPILMISLSAIIIIAILALVLINKIDQVRQLNQALNKLKQSFEDLDEQAKLIVKTDLELNKAQEELDKRLSALNALQKISRLISTTLDVNEIFERLNKPLVDELGFEKILVLMLDENKNFESRIASGFSKADLGYILKNFKEDRSFDTVISEGRGFSSLNAPKIKKEKMTDLFVAEHFILSPILSQNGVIGILFVGNTSKGLAITEGDEELITILANQIGQSLENAQLFEQVYRSRQELESKVQDRTKELADALEELKIISKSKSEFVSAVSHELRTPLTSIKGYASILMTGKIGEIPQEVKERLGKIDKHSDNLVKLINDLLDISRIEAGRVEMKFQTHNMSDIIDNIKDLLTPQIKEKNIELITHLAPNIPHVFIDRSQIERVFINLLGNALKFTPQNGKIMIDAKLQDDSVLFQISDTGIGIKEEDIPNLFREFYRVENEINNTVKGTGLGLALAKNIIEAHKGKIWVTSKINQGTTFYFEIPLKKDPTPQSKNA